MSHHFLRLTRVHLHRWTDEMDEALVVDVVEIIAHGDAKQSIAGALILLQQEVIPHERGTTGRFVQSIP